jgi:hypothetical protein
MSLGILFVCAPASGELLSVADLRLVATIQTRGQYDDAGLGTWNGQPLSSTNHPTVDQDQLSATWSYYVDPASRNVLDVVATEVLDTAYGFIFGSPFDLVALTGFTFTLQGAFTSFPTFSNARAIPGERLSGPDPSTNVPLTATPGWGLTAIGGTPNSAVYAVDASSVNYGLTHFPQITGETRIGGGAVFEFVFDASVDLLRDADFTSLAMTARNGMGAYVEDEIARTLFLPTDSENPPGVVSEPPAIALVGVGLLVAWGSHARKRYGGDSCRPYKLG